MEKEQQMTTESGIPVYSYRNPASHGFYISLFLRAGGMYEQPGDDGITHFLEHTVIRNINRLLDGKFYAVLDRSGLCFNAATYAEMVQFYVYGATEHFEEAARLIAMVLSPLVLSRAEIDAERRRVKAEIRENDDKSSLANFTASVLFEGTSLALPITGTLGSVSRITGRRLEAYRRAVCTPENLFFYVTGNFSDADIRALAAAADGFPLAHGAPRSNLAPVPARYGNRGGEVRIKQADYTAVRFSFDMDMTRCTLPETDLLYDILLSGYNSRLFIEMSEKRGFFYDINGMVDRYANIGTFTFDFEVQAKDLYEAVEMTVSILRDVKEHGFSPSEILRSWYVDNALLSYDDYREFNFLFAYANHIMSAGYASLDDQTAAYRAVTAERLCELAREIFRPENLLLTLKADRKKTDAERLRAIVAAL